MNNAKYVDPIIGTVGDERKSFCHGGGKTYPGACMPGGMVQLSPDTISAGDNTSGYNYCMNTIEGFSFNHMSGVGWYGDLGNVQVMPVVGKTDLRSGTNAEMPFRKGGEGWKSAYRNEMEHARAGYYSVLLDRYDILAEATVSMRTGYLRFTYPASGESGLMFNFSRRIGGHVDFQHVEIVSDTRVEGYLICTPAGGGWGKLNTICISRLNFPNRPAHSGSFRTRNTRRRAFPLWRGRMSGWMCGLKRRRRNSWCSGAAFPIPIWRARGATFSLKVSDLTLTE